jgi:hypothetical protein
MYHILRGLPIEHATITATSFQLPSKPSNYIF